MRKIQELHEEVDEVNYFLREWQRLAKSTNPDNRIIQKPEIRFVAHAIERVIKSAESLEIPLELMVGTEPVLAQRFQRISQKSHRSSLNWLIPSRTAIQLTYFRKLSTNKGNDLSFVGNEKGLMSLRLLAKTVAQGGELRISGKHAGDWSA